MADKTHRCLVCKGNGGWVFFAAESQPVLIGMLWPDQDSARRCPRGDIVLAFCPDCGHVWNTAFDAGRVSYDRAYDNSLHFSPTFQRYTEALVARLVDTYGLRDKDIIDIGGGKGDFLAMLCAAGCNRGHGFDPSYDGKRTPTPPGVEITWRRDYYDDRHAAVQADLLTSRFVFEHIADPAGFLAMIRDGVRNPSRTIVYFEVPNIDLIVRQMSPWDVIYEHVSYFSPESLSRAFVGAGFQVLDVRETYSRQFLSIEARVSTGATGTDGHQGDVSGLARDVNVFAKNAAARFAEWRGRLADWTRSGARTVAWGAGAKAVGFLNMLGVADAIAAVVDVNPHKHGRRLAGTGQLIIAPTDLCTIRPDIIVLMNSIYRDEIAVTLDELGLQPELIAA